MLKNKIVLSFISASLLLTLLAPMSIYASSSAPAHAEYQPVIISQTSKPSLFWNNVRFCEATVDSSGKTLYINVSADVKTGTKVSGTIYLEKYINGRWSSVASWSVSSTGNLNADKTYTGFYGTKYRTRFSGTATYSGKSEKVSASSVSIVL